MTTTSVTLQVPLFGPKGELREHSLVDAADYEQVMQWRWTLHSGGYAIRSVRENGEMVHIFLHRFLMNFPQGLIDHINRNPMDNRRQNLRPATQAENLRNRGRNKNNRSGFKGVYRAKNSPNCWIAELTLDRVKVRRACFSTAEAAARGYDAWAKELHGEFACLNFPENV